MKNKKRLIDYTIILIFAIAISIPMLSQNFNIYVDDGIQHIARLMGTMQSIEEGQVIPVIMSNFCNGFGYSWNLFYSPITAYIPLIFSIFTNSFELMLKIFIVLVGFLSGIAMYEFVNKISKNRYAGLFQQSYISVHHIDLQICICEWQYPNLLHLYFCRLCFMECITYLM